MDYLKPDEIGKFNELVRRLEETVWQLRLVTKRMEIKECDIHLLNFDDFDEDGWLAKITSLTDSDKEGTFTTYKAEIKDGQVISVNAQVVKIGGTE